MTATVRKRIKRRNVAQLRRKLQLDISRSFGTRHPATKKVSRRSHIPFSIEFFFKDNGTVGPPVSHGELEGPYIYTDPNNTHTVTPIWIPGFSILMSWFCVPRSRWHFVSKHLVCVYKYSRGNQNSPRLGKITTLLITEYFCNHHWLSRVRQPLCWWRKIQTQNHQRYGHRGHIRQEMITEGHRRQRRQELRSGSWLWE